jgi:putative transposase
LKYNPRANHRRSIRLPGYDYSQPGAYFTTICTLNRECALGDIIDGVMRLNDAGRIADRWWRKLPEKFSNVEIDAYVVMPNHVHGIIVIVGDHRDGAVRGRCDEIGGRRRKSRVDRNDLGRTHGCAPTQHRCDRGPAVGTDPCVRPYVDPTLSSSTPIRPDLSHIIRWFKTMTVNERLRSTRGVGAADTVGKMWQRNYYEHIIRDDEALAAVRLYIEGNPGQWAADPDHPDRWKDTNARQDA